MNLKKFTKNPDVENIAWYYDWDLEKVYDDE